MTQSSEMVVQAFIGTAHHKNLCLIYVTHNIYGSSHKNWTTCVRNAAITVIMKQPRNAVILSNIARQLLPPGKTKALSAAFQMAVRDQELLNGNRYGYLIINCSTHSKTEDCLRTGIFEDEKYKFVYLIL